MLSLGSLVCKYYDTFVASRLSAGCWANSVPRVFWAWRSKSEQSNSHLALIYAIFEH